MSQRDRLAAAPLGALVAPWTPPQYPSSAEMAGHWCRLERADPRRHSAELYEANSHDRDARMWAYMPYGPFATEEEYGSWLEKSCRGDDPLYFAIIDRIRGRAVGIASYLRIEPPHGCIEVGHLAFSPLLQRTVAATEAMYLMMKRVFEAGYRRCEWKCATLNAASRTAAHRLGFSYEGTFRQARVVKGRNRDTAWYSLLDKEWPVIDAAFRAWLSPENFDALGRQRTPLSELTSRALPRERG